MEVVVQEEGPRPFRLQLVLDHLRAADLLPLSVSAVLDVQEADGIRAGKVVQFADAPGKKGRNEVDGELGFCGFYDDRAGFFMRSVLNVKGRSPIDRDRKSVLDIPSFPKVDFFS